MKLKSTHTWQCDTCNAEVEGSAENPPLTWRHFALSERTETSKHCYRWQTNLEFCVCDKCHKDRYHNMHPIRKALTLAGVFKKGS